jgi:hypothetical protein
MMEDRNTEPSPHCVIGRKPYMNSVTEIVDTHLAAYCKPDQAERLDLLTKAWVADGDLAAREG